jgi:hypothetical protein
MKSNVFYRRLAIDPSTLSDEPPPPLTLKQNAEDAVHSPASQSLYDEIPKLGFVANQKEDNC